MTNQQENLTVELVQLADVGGPGPVTRSASTSTPNLQSDAAQIRAVEAAALAMVEEAISLPRRGGSANPLATLISLRVGNGQTRAAVSIIISRRSTPACLRTVTETADNNWATTANFNRQAQEAEVAAVMAKLEAAVAVARAVAETQAEAAAEVAEVEVVEVTAEAWARARGATRKRRAPP
jgi:hypothetical protein